MEEANSNDIPISYEHRIIENDIQQLKSLCVIDTNYPIVSHRKVLGPFIVLLKKIMRKVLNKSFKWYINPMIEQQNRVNENVVETLDLYNKSLQSNLRKCLDEVDRQDILIEELNKKLEAFTEQNAEISKKLETLDKQDDELDRKVATLDKRNEEVKIKLEIFDEQNAEINKKLETITEQSDEVNKKLETITEQSDEVNKKFGTITEQDSESRKQLSENIESLARQIDNINISFGHFVEQNDESHSNLAENIESIARQANDITSSFAESFKQNDDSHILLSENIESVSKHAQEINNSLLRVIAQNEEMRRNLVENIESVEKHAQGVEDSLVRVIGQNDESHQNLAENIESVNMQRNDNYIELVAKLKEHSDKLKYMTRVLNIACDTKLLNKRINYLDFENRFRGTREEIMEKQRQFVHYFKDTSHGAEILDIGCGRGEFLELMASEEIKAYGVDVYKPFVTYCKRRGFRVENCDALTHLSNIPDGVLGGVFMDSVIEHVTDDYIVALMGTVYKKLRPGCYFIITTPNPETLAGLNCFNIDLEHKKPIHYLTLEYLLKKENFMEVTRYETKEADFPIKVSKLEGDFPNKDKFNEGIEEINKFVFGNREYVVIARK